MKCVTCFCASLISARAGPSVTIMSSQQSAKQGEAVSSHLKQRVAFISGEAAEKQDHGSNENAWKIELPTFRRSVASRLSQRTSELPVDWTALLVYVAQWQEYDTESTVRADRYRRTAEFSGPGQLSRWSDQLWKSVPFTDSWDQIVTWRPLREDKANNSSPSCVGYNNRWLFASKPHTFSWHSGSCSSFPARRALWV